MTNTTDTTDTTATITDEEVRRWVESYLQAWRSNDAASISALFTENAEYHEEPYETDWYGREEIVAGWQSRWDWQQGGWSFDWTIASRAGRTAVVVGVGRYVKLGNFDNAWTMTFDTGIVCSRFEMVNTEQG